MCGLKHNQAEGGPWHTDNVIIGLYKTNMELIGVLLTRNNLSDGMFNITDNIWLMAPRQPDVYIVITLIVNTINDE